jgi:hypothetical protein
MTLEVNLWNRDLLVSEAQRDRMVDYILTHLSRCPQGRQSVSFLTDMVRMETRLKFPTRMTDAETMFEALGFTLVREGRVTYVTL